MLRGSVLFFIVGDCTMCWELDMNIGIIGAGSIACKMAATVKAVGETFYAIASRSQQKADKFASDHGAQKAYGSYEQLASDPAVDLVYIATPHSEHYANIMMCLEHARNVICEKSFTMTADEARKAFSYAESHGLLLTEAIWTRYLPTRAIVDSYVKRIGELRMLTANLAYDIWNVPRICRADLGGGALRDVGVYTLNFMAMHFGVDFSSFESTALIKDGVDIQCQAAFSYPDGKIAQLFSGTQCLSDRRGMIYGTKGFVEVDNINEPEAIMLYDNSRTLIEQAAIPKSLTGFEFELESSLKAIREHRTECPEMPHGESILMMEIMDAMRERWACSVKP